MTVRHEPDPKIRLFRSSRDRKCSRPYEVFIGPRMAA
jgi:hypothetical protein